MAEKIPTGPRGREKSDSRVFPPSTLAYDNWSYQHTSLPVRPDKQQQLLPQKPILSSHPPFGSVGSSTFRAPVMGQSGGITSLPAGGGNMQIHSMSQLSGHTGTPGTRHMTSASGVPQAIQAVYRNYHSESQSTERGRESPTAFIQRVLTEKQQEERLQRDRERERQSALRAERGDNFSGSHFTYCQDCTETAPPRPSPITLASSFSPSLNPFVVPQRDSPVASVSTGFNRGGNNIGHDSPYCTDYIHPERRKVMDGYDPDSDMPWDKMRELSGVSPAFISATNANMCPIGERRKHITLPIREIRPIRETRGTFKSAPSSSEVYPRGRDQACREAQSSAPQSSSGNSKRVQPHPHDPSAKRLKTLSEIKRIEEENKRLSQENHSIQTELRGEIEIAETRAARQRQAEKDKKLRAQEKQLQALISRNEKLKREYMGLKFKLEKAKTVGMTLLGEELSLKPLPKLSSGSIEFDTAPLEQTSIMPAITTSNEEGGVTLKIVPQDTTPMALHGVYIKQEDNN